MNSPKRNGIDIFTKMKIIDDIEAGERHSPIQQRYNFKNLSKVTRIVNDKERVKSPFLSNLSSFRRS